jgi:hypothetical protein
VSSMIPEMPNSGVPGPTPGPMPGTAQGGKSKRHRRKRNKRATSTKKTGRR